MTQVTHVLQSTCHCEKVETPPTRAQSRCFRTSFCTVRWWRLASEVQTTVGTWSGWELNSIFSVGRKFLYVYVKSFDSPRWEWENHYSDPYLVGCCSYPKDSTCSDSDGCAKLTAAVGSLRHAANWKHQAHAIVFSAPRIAPKTTANSLGFPTTTWGYVPRYAPGIPTQSRRRRYHSYSVCPNYPVNKNPLLWTFARGLESEFAIAGPLICVFRVWFVESDVLVDLIGQTRLWNTYWQKSRHVTVSSSGYSLWRIPCFDPLIGSQQNTWNSRKWQLTYLTYFCPSPWKLGRNPRNNTSFSDRTTVILGLSILISCGLLFILADAIPWQVLSGFRPCIFCNWCALRSAWVFLGNWDGLNTTRWSIRLANLTWRLD